MVGPLARPLALLAALLTTAAGGGAPGAGSPPAYRGPLPAYRVDLGRPPRERWTPVLEDFVARRGTAPFRGFYSAVLSQLNATAPEIMAFYRSHLPEWKEVYARHHPDALAEMQTLAAVLSGHAGSAEERWLFAEDQVFLAQLHIQIFNIVPSPSEGDRRGLRPDEAQECTSVVVRRPPGAGGATTLHFRNWDFGPSPEALGSASVNVEFADGTAEGFRCALALTHIAKWTTCLRPGAFSMSLDARAQGVGSEHGRSPEEELRLLREGRLPRIAVMRQVMRARSYHEAVGRAAAVRPLTSLYLILADGSPGAGGNAGGAVVTLRGNGSSADVMPMPSPGEEDDWFVVQTNVDHGVAAGPGVYSSYRREHVKALLRRLGPNASAEALYGVLRNREVFPEGNVGQDDGRVFRPSTIMSVLMVPTARGSDGAWRTDLWRSLGGGPAAESATLLV